MNKTVLKLSAIYLTLAAVLTTPSLAAKLAFQLVNDADQAITLVQITPEAGAAPITLFTGSLATAAAQAVNLTTTTETCVFTLSYTRANNTTQSVPDIDLCQTEKLALQ